MCARDCPTEVLCQQACVRNDHEEKPVEIGLLQRYATDSVLNNGVQLFSRAEDTGKSIAVVGGGPAGISCAHRLAVFGHKITVYEAEDKLGGLKRPFIRGVNNTKYSKSMLPLYGDDIIIKYERFKHVEIL